MKKNTMPKITITKTNTKHNVDLEASSIIHEEDKNGTIYSKDNCYALQRRDTKYFYSELEYFENDIVEPVFDINLNIATIYPTKKSAQITKTFFQKYTKLKLNIIPLTRETKIRKETKC